MAVVTRVRRLVANPQRRKKRARRNPKHRRRMTAKQIKFFGTKRQRAALKAHRRRKAKVVHKSAGLKVAVNPRRKVRARRRKAPAKRKRSSNPALIVTLGAVNPRGGSTVAAKKRRKKARRASNPRRRRRNATRVVVTAPRRRNRRYTRRRRSVARRRNPAMFGIQRGGMAKAVVSGLAGMAATKFLPTLIPGQFVQGNLMRTVASGAAAFVSQIIAKQLTKDQTIADAVLFGGLIQTGSVALNAFVPGLAAQFGLTGMGQIMDANWTIPENPLRAAPAIAPAGDARMGVSGLARAYGNAY